MSGFKVISILCVILCLQFISQTTGDGSIERLHHDLFKNLDKTIAPYLRTGKKVNVELSVSVIRVDNLPDDSQLNLFLWLTQTWKEPTLRWSPQEYGNISQISLPASHIWTPDLSVYSAIKASQVFPEVPKSMKVVIQHDGAITFVLPQSVTVPANHTEENVSFSIKFGSWIANGNEIDFLKGSVDSSSYTPNKCLEAKSFDMVRNVVRYSCCPDPYVDISVTGSFKNVC